ncbi:MAG: MOSC domain-containing protein [Syntrophomonadaceae bacterium]|nr:MOSC domain-containing protein [Syntrophomonadaceae bacterium]
MEGKVLAVCYSQDKGERKTDIREGYFKKEHGLVDDAHSGPWHRQVSLLGIDSINKMRARGVDVNPGDLAENLTVEGIELYSLPVGTRLKAGENVLLEVTQIGKECHKGCAIRTQVGDCVMPREGIFARVLEEGWIRAGDKIEVLRDV